MAKTTIEHTYFVEDIKLNDTWYNRQFASKITKPAPYQAPLANTYVEKPSLISGVWKYWSSSKKEFLLLSNDPNRIINYPLEGIDVISRAYDRVANMYVSLYKAKNSEKYYCIYEKYIAQAFVQVSVLGAVMNIDAELPNKETRVRYNVSCPICKNMIATVQYDYDGDALSGEAYNCPYCDNDDKYTHIELRPRYKNMSTDLLIGKEDVKTNRYLQKKIDFAEQVKKFDLSISQINPINTYNVVRP